MLAVGVVILVSTLLTFFVAGQTTALIYSKLVVGLLLIGAYLATNKESARRMVGNRSTTLILLSSLTAAVFVGVLGALNYISAKNPKEFDVTREGLFTLADQTEKTLAGLKEPVKVLAFYRSDEPQYRTAKDALERYKGHAQGKLEVEFIDPVQHPEDVERYQIREGGSRIIFTAKGMHEARPKDVTEQELTNALVKVTSSSTKKIYFLSGHGESDIADTGKSGLSELVTLLKNEGYEVAPFSFAAGEAAAGTAIDLNATASKPQGELVVPHDAELVIALAPKVPLSAPEVDALAKFADRGGRIIVGLEARRETGLERLALMWHIEAKNDLVVDTNPVAQMIGLPPTMALVQEYTDHPITKDFRQPIALLTARSVNVKDNGPGAVAGVTAKVLAKTGRTAWGETDFASGRASRDANDTPGPVGLVAVATKHTTAPDKLADEGRIVVFGDSDFATNAYLQFQANDDFLLNSVNFLADEEGKISIRPKQRGSSRIFLTETQSDIIKFSSMDILPVGIFAIGMAVRGKRRRK